MGLLLAGAALNTRALEFSGLLDLRGLATDTQRSWTREGSGKTRVDAHSSTLRLGQAVLRTQAEFTDTLTGTLVLNAYDERAGLVDATEAFVQWSPVPVGPWKLRLKAGAFFPASSVEIDYDSTGWTPTRTLSSAAINSWIGEEIRSKGIELNLLRKGRSVGSPHDYGFTVAVFGGNDPAGTLLAWRGWSVSDRITGLREPLRLPDLPVFRAGAALASQDRTLHIAREIDQRPGFYLGAQYAYKQSLELAAQHYDNRGDPLVLQDGQYAWNTWFDHASLRWKPGGHWDVLAQVMRGQTLMGPAAVQLGFRSAYILVSHPLGTGQLSARLDHFDTRENDILPDDPNDETGRALAVAYRHPLSTSVNLVTELLVVRSQRGARTLIHEPVRQHENSLTSALQWRF